MRETSGGRTPIGHRRQDGAPTHEPDTKSPDTARFIFYLCLSLGAFLAIYLPTQILRPSPGPAIEVEADGYFLSYTAPLLSKRFPANMFIGKDNTGRCLVGNTPPGWDAGLCDVRLQQIKARDCKVVPAFDDEHCHAMPLQGGPKGELRSTHILFTIREGEATQAREIGPARN